MVDIIKKDMTDIWAVAGDVVAPDSSKVRAGWGVEVVPRQWWNWFENRQDTNIAYMLQKGIPEWDQFTEYLANKSYVQRNGVVYKCIRTAVNVDPESNPPVSSWAKAFPESTPYLEAIKGTAVAPNTLMFIGGNGQAQNATVTAYGLSLLNQSTALAARTTLDAQQANSNLTALSGVSAAVNVLPYFNGPTSMTGTQLTAYGRSLIGAASASAARDTLGLTESATRLVQTNQTDNTEGRLAIVGTFGIGRNLDLRSTTYPSAIPSALTYAGTVFGLANGATDGNSALSIPALGSGTVLGSLQINGQYSDLSAQGAFNRIFTTLDGRQFIQTAASASAWGTWKEVWTSGNLVKTGSRVDQTADRILKVGDFGLGTLSPVPLNDANEADKTTTWASGFYEVPPNSTWPNRPLPGWTRILHHSHGNTSGGYATQYATGGFNIVGTPNRYFNRTLTAGSWSSWVELYHTGNSSDLVSQVQTGIQPQLNAKLDLAQYGRVDNLGDGATADPNTTSTVSMLTNHANGPISAGAANGYYMINTTYFESKVAGSYTRRVQVAYGTESSGSPQVWARSWNSSGGWKSWVRCDNNGNSATASRWESNRSITLTGGVTGATSFDGSSNFVLNTTVTPDSHSHSISTITGLQATLDSCIKNVGQQIIYHNGGAMSQGRGTGALMIQPTDPAASSAGNTPSISFHRPGVFGVNLGLGTVNTSELCIGGYTMGVVEYPIVHTGNISSKIAAAGTTGAVGTYALLRNTSVATDQTPGTVVAGSNLVYSNVSGNVGGAANSPAGSWRMMGQLFANGNNGAGGITLFFRIA